MINMLKLHKTAGRSFVYKNATSKPCMSPLRSGRARTTARKILTAASPDDKPDWLKQLVEDAQEDPELAAMLNSTDGTPEDVQRRMREEMDALNAQISVSSASGSTAPVQVAIQNHDPFNLWIWLELYNPATSQEEEIIQEVIGSWFLVGRLGGYDSGNLQVMYADPTDADGVEYETRDGLAATMHDMGDVETKREWLRFWLDMGTADELALDVLINALCTLSREHVGIKKIIIGGDNPAWPAPLRDDGLPSVTMNPMRLVGDDPDDAVDDDGYSF